MTESSETSPKPPARATAGTTRAAATKPAGAAAGKVDATAAAPTAARIPAVAAKPAGKRAPARTRAAAPAAVWKVATEPAYRHPNLGLAPIDMTAGHAAAAARLRAIASQVSAAALEAAVRADPTIRTRNDDIALRTLLRDGTLIVERLAMCLASDKTLWLTEFAEWLGPIYRRRGMSQGDLAACCEGMRSAVEPHLSADEMEVAARALDGAAAVFRRNGRLGGDPHKRNTFLEWIYRGV